MPASIGELGPPLPWTARFCTAATSPWAPFPMQAGAASPALPARWVCSTAERVWVAAAAVPGAAPSGLWQPGALLVQCPFSASYDRRRSPAPSATTSCLPTLPGAGSWPVVLGLVDGTGSILERWLFCFFNMVSFGVCGMMQRGVATLQRSAWPGSWAACMACPALGARVQRACLLSSVCLLPQVSCMIGISECSVPCTLGGMHCGRGSARCSRQAAAAHGWLACCYQGRYPQPTAQPSPPCSLAQCPLLPPGYGSYPPVSWPEVLLWIFSMISLAAMFAIWNGLIFTFVLTATRSGQEFKDKMDQLRVRGVGMHAAPMPRLADGLWGHLLSWRCVLCCAGAVGESCPPACGVHEHLA